MDQLQIYPVHVGVKVCKCRPVNQEVKSIRNDTGNSWIGTQLKI